MSSKPSLWHRAIAGLETRAYVRLIQTHALSAAGDGLVTVALAGSVFFNDSPDAARSRVALTLLLTVAPFAVVAPFLGPAIDRARGGRRLMLVGASTARAVLCLLMAVSLDSVALYPVAFLTLVASKAHAVAKSATVPEIVADHGMLVKANSRLAVGAVLAGFVSAFLGFLFSQVGGSEWVLRAAAVIFTCSAALAFEVNGRSRERQSATRAETTEQILGTDVWRAAAIMATLRASVGFLAFLIAFDLRRRGAATLWFGLVLSASMVGSSLGNLVASHVRSRIREERILIAVIATLCVSAAVLATTAGRLTAALLALILSACAALGKLAFDSLVQRDAPKAVQGRSFARFEAIFQFVWVIGALVPVVLTITTHHGFFLLAALAGTVGTWYALGPKKTRSIQRNVDPG